MLVADRHRRPRRFHDRRHAGVQIANRGAAQRQRERAESKYAYWLMQHKDWRVLNCGSTANARIRLPRDSTVTCSPPSSCRGDSGGRERCTRGARSSPGHLPVARDVTVPGRPESRSSRARSFRTRATPEQNARMHDINAWIADQAGAIPTSGSWTRAKPLRQRRIPITCRDPRTVCIPTSPAIEKWRRIGTVLQTALAQRERG
jgi:hypothetical protein